MFDFHGCGLITRTPLNPNDIAYPAEVGYLVPGIGRAFSARTFSIRMGELGVGGFYKTPGTVKGFSGDRWADGNLERSFMWTVIGPNGPSCSAGGGAGGNAIDAVIPPSSNHPGGVHALFGDGSVQFITDSIDTGDLGMPTQNSGPSRYGVWGALGTKSGSEPVQLP